MKAARIAVLALAFALAPAARAQGCSQCRDNVSQSSPATQAGYRKAILVMGGVATTLFLGTVVLALRSRSKST